MTTLPALNILEESVTASCLKVSVDLVIFYRQESSAVGLWLFQLLDLGVL